MTSIEHIDSGTFFNQVGSVPVGDTYEAYSGEEGDVSKNDLVVFSDPDAGMHAKQCPLALDHDFVGWVKTVYAFDPSFRDGISPEVGITGPLGRLSIDEGYVHVVPTAGNSHVKGEPLEDDYDGPQWAFDFVRRFYESDDYERYQSVERHGGWGAVGKERAKEMHVCDDCLGKEHGVTHVDGK